MELSKNFEHGAAEAKWYLHWLDKKYFSSKPDHREPYTIVIPPPNVTGILHMGHSLNNTIQDILIRRARMIGKNACWVPGTDHASIATEAKVVQMLREKGINKSNLSREEFLAHAWEWKEKYGGIILSQLKKLGCSFDWDRTTFTMDGHYYDSVIDVFIDLHKKGMIYRGERMINWDPRAKTALSDEEVIYKEVQGKLYQVQYLLDDGSGDPLKSALHPEYITIATVRPETILGDAAIAVNPSDERYTTLHGRFAFVPLINRRIPIIADEYVTTDFGTGALKVTPAHDKNDYLLGQKHKLPVIDTFNEDGTMSEAAQLYIGEDRFAVRKKIAAELEATGHLVKTEAYTHQVGFSERTDVVIEHRPSLQWWVDMKKLHLPALEAVINGDINFFPPKFRNLYKHWMENIRDWCISRQLWWGQRIPAWYDAEGNVFVAKNIEEAEAARKKAGNLISKSPLRQDDDVLDTWFSSWLWPIEVFKGYSDPGNADINYYYPTNTLVTAPEIIFFWVARMIMAGYEFKNEKPFHDVYFTGIVRDEIGRKMSKQLGNSPDLLALIEKYGADAVRFGVLISSPAGNDLLFDVKEESTLKQGSFFINKIWNALRLVKMWEARVDIESKPSAEARFALDWMENRLHQARQELDQMYQEFRLSEALKLIYSLVWDDFCSWYLEWVKPGFEQPVEKIVYEKTVGFFEQLMQLAHPFMPFLSEEIYHLLEPRKEGDDITISQLPKPGVADQKILGQAALLKEIITAVRDAKNKNQVKPKDEVKIFIQSADTLGYRDIQSILQKQLNASSLEFTPVAVPGAITVVVQKDTFYLQTANQSDNVLQKEQLQKDLEYFQGFLLSVEKKLSNEKFVQNAKPEIVEAETRKKQDAEAKIRTIRESLERME
jgi:valyl-tRNA synthetase